MAGRKASSIVYVGSAGTSEVHVIELDPQGGLSRLAQVHLRSEGEHGPSTPLAVSPDRRFLYAGMRSQPFVVIAFRIDPASGALEFMGSAPLADSMAYIATDRTGRYLLSASYGGSKVAVNPIDQDGEVQPPIQVVATEPKAHAILPDPTNKAVLATSLGGDVLHRFRFDPATGLLSGGEPAATVQLGSGPRHFRFHPNGRFLFLLNELSATIDVFSHEGEEGRLRHLQTVSALPEGFSGRPWAADLQLTPDGRFLYASERTSSRLQGFRIDSGTGLLERGGSIPTETQPRGFAIDPGGHFAVVAGEVSNAVSSYEVDPATGDLTPRARIQAGVAANWVEIVVLP
jgi:6-phosphogluconolactonase